MLLIKRLWPGSSSWPLWRHQRFIANIKRFFGQWSGYICWKHIDKLIHRLKGRPRKCRAFLRGCTWGEVGVTGFQRCVALTLHSEAQSKRKIGRMMHRKKEVLTLLGEMGQVR